MTRSELIKKLCQQYPQLPDDAVRHMVHIIFTIMADHLTHKSPIQLRGFGTFFTRSLPARTAKHPSQNRTIELQQRHVIKFRPSRQLLQRIKNKQ